MEMIAERCGVHRSTVQRALRNSPLISPVTAERVRAVAVELGYDPAQQVAAARLVSRRHGTNVLNQVVALFLPALFYLRPYYQRLMRGLLEVLVAEKFDLLVTYLQPDTKNDTLPRSIVGGSVDGVMTVVDGYALELLRDALRATPYFAQRPVISMIFATETCPAVLADDAQGMRDACRHLLELGHRHILYLHTDNGRGAMLQRRVAGLEAAYRDAGLSPAQLLQVIEIPWGDTPILARFATTLTEAIRRYPRATAVLLPNDTYAVDARNALKGIGLRVPEEISLLGFDDTESLLDEDGKNILTTVQVPLEEIGRRTAQLIIRQVRDKETATPAITMLSTTLIVRQSTAPPRAVETTREV